MSRRIIALATLLSAFVLAPSFAAMPDVFYNGARQSIAASEARLLAIAGRAEPGFSLGELFPIQLEAWRLELITDKGPRLIEADNLGERLYDIHVVQSTRAWDIVLDSDARGIRERIEGVTRLELKGEPNPEKSLEVWVSWEGVTQLKGEIRRWAERAGVSVKVIDVPSIKSKLITVLRGGGKVPDLVMIQSDYIPDLVEAGALQAIDGLRLPESGSKGKQAFALGGRLLAAPFYCDTQLVFYSTTLIRGKPELDWNLGDMERLAVASGASTPCAWNAYSAYWFLPFVIGFGKDTIIDQGGTMHVMDPAYGKALHYLSDAITRGFMQPMERDAMMAYFTSGKTAFILSGSYSLPEFKRLGIPFGVAPFPLVSPGGKRVAPLLDYKGWAVTRTSKSPVLARRLIQYLSGAELQATFCASQGKLPANDEAWSLLPDQGEYLATLKASYDAGVTVPPEPVYGIFKNALWKLLRLYLGGQMSSDDMLAALAVIMNE
ncbi:hypothetical protein MASR2M48_23070 [Spirochaetota bacterium]